MPAHARHIEASMPECQPLAWTCRTRVPLRGAQDEPAGAQAAFADRIIALGHHPARLDLARSFGAAAVVTQRGEDAVAAIRELTDGHGTHATIEAVGTRESMRTALRATRPGGAIGWVGAPHGNTDALDPSPVFDTSAPLESISTAYQAMDARTALKPLITPGL